MRSEFVQGIPRDLLLDIPPMPRALIGAGLMEQVGVEAREMGFRRALLVSTGLRETGIVDEVAALLRSAGVEPAIPSFPRKVACHAAGFSFNCENRY